jgi:hypothetical protein
MRLSDLRRVAVKKQVRIRFPLANGMQCVVDEHGISRVPELLGVPEFNLEKELADVSSFTVEPAAPGAQSDKLDRAGVEALVAACGPGIQTHVAEE